MSQPTQKSAEIPKINSTDEAEQADAKAMPPPPNPPKLLEAEVNSLSACLKSAVVKTGQIYGFFADAHRLNLGKHIHNPPHSLMAALGQEVERYDQICDSIDSQLIQAIAVLERDLRREEDRIKAETLASIRTSPEPMIVSPSVTMNALPTETPTVIPTPKTSPHGSGPARRPSAISISSLHRPSFPPLKTDMITSPLHMSPEEALLHANGLASPVYLAPKSARALGSNEFPPEFMAAFASATSANGNVSNTSVDLDLTVPDSNGQEVQMTLDTTVGSSADKPIELDLEGMDIDMASMPDLFGDSLEAGPGDTNAGVDDLFSPVLEGGDASLASMEGAENSDKAGAEFLESLNVDGSTSNDIFAALSQESTHGGSSSHPGMIPQSQAAPSPSSILAEFSSSSHLAMGPSSTSTNNLGGNESGFDYSSLDLSQLDSGFFAQSSDPGMDFSMEDFLSMTGEQTAKDNNNDETKASI